MQRSDEQVSATNEAKHDAASECEALSSRSFHAIPKRAVRANHQHWRSPSCLKAKRQKTAESRRNWASAQQALRIKPYNGRSTAWAGLGSDPRYKARYRAF